jgi:integrase
MEISLISGAGPAEGAPTPENGLVEAQQRLRQMVLDSVPSPNSRRNYARALDDLFALAAGRPLTRALLMEYRASMEALAPSTINVRLSAVRKLVAEARQNGLIGAEEAASLSAVPNIRQKGTRLGNWLTREQARELLAVPDRSTLKAKRDYCILALLVGCALRRQELATLTVGTLQLREGRWVLADLEGKGRRIRTVAVPAWVKQAIDAWRTAAGIEDGRLLRSIAKGGKIGESLGDWAVWSVVEQSAREIGIEHFGAHDLRRTCARLCRKAGGDLEQIKFLLGHSSIQTTERYLGSEQEIAIAVNDHLGL